MLKPGSPAPEVVLHDQHGRVFRLSLLHGSKNAVLFFYPKDETAICTKEACAFRDSYEAFVASDTVVIGISDDDVASHQGFAEHWRLPFTLLSDTDGRARKAFGVDRWLGLLRGRATFVIDKQGIIRAVVNDRFSAERHVNDALAAIRDQAIR
jgi:thioredoxin-dependent peroxiredoxin